jgi:periplasmic copper chaperone A
VQSTLGEAVIEARWAEEALWLQANEWLCIACKGMHGNASSTSALLRSHARNGWGQMRISGGNRRLRHNASSKLPAFRCPPENFHAVRPSHIRHRRFFLLASAAHPALTHGFKAGSLQIVHPWARATPAGAKTGVGYCVIANSSAVPDRLLSATAEIAGRTEIHEMAVKDGIMTMRALPDGLAILANGSAELTPSGYHLMFLDLRRPLKQGESFPGTLTFEKAGTVSVTFVVEAMSATGAGHGDLH